MTMLNLYKMSVAIEKELAANIKRVLINCFRLECERSIGYCKVF